MTNLRKELRESINSLTQNPVQLEIMEGILDSGSLDCGLFWLDDHFDFANAIAALQKCITVLKQYNLQESDMLEGETPEMYIQSAMEDWKGEIRDPFLERPRKTNK